MRPFYIPTMNTIGVIFENLWGRRQLSPHGLLAFASVLGSICYSVVDMTNVRALFGGNDSVQIHWPFL